VSWETLFRSDDQAWRTPRWLFEQIHTVCAFDLDAAAHPDNALCVSKYLTEEDDALSIEEWPGESVWLNPPYGRQVGKFVAKAREQAEVYGKTVVVLIFARTDTRWWQDHAMEASAIFLIRGRLKFHKATGEKDAAPAPSALLVFSQYGPVDVSFYRFDRTKPEEWKEQLRKHVTCWDPARTRSSCP